jgi:hypothetical protein
MFVIGGPPVCIDSGTLPNHFNRLNHPQNVGQEKINQRATPTAFTA